MSRSHVRNFRIPAAEAELKKIEAMRMKEDKK